MVSFDSSSSSYESPVFNRKRFDRSEPSSENGTPVGSPRKAPTPSSTPKKVKALEERIVRWDTDCDLMAKDVRIMEEGIGALEELADTPGRKKRSAVASRVGKSAFRELFKAEDVAPNPFSPDFHTKGTQLLRESSGWVTGLLARTSGIHNAAQHQIDEQFPIVIDLDHLTNAGKNGFHFCPVGHHLRDQRDHVIVNPRTGVMCGFYKGKFSTFFPDCIATKEQLVHEILNSGFQSRAENRQLRYIHPENGAGFYIETYVQEEVKRSSVFPIFFVANWLADCEFEIHAHLRISSQQVLEAIRDPRSSIRYESDDHVIYDIAQTLPTANVIPVGIYFTIPKEAL